MSQLVDLVVYALTGYRSQVGGGLTKEEIEERQKRFRHQQMALAGIDPDEEKPKRTAPEIPEKYKNCDPISFDSQEYHNAIKELELPKDYNQPLFKDMITLDVIHPDKLIIVFGQCHDKEILKAWILQYKNRTYYVKEPKTNKYIEVELLEELGIDPMEFRHTYAKDKQNPQARIISMLGSNRFDPDDIISRTRSLLEEKVVDVDYIYPKTHHTALHLAINNNNVALVKLLLQHKANPDLAYVDNRFSIKPINMATYTPISLEIIQALTEAGANLNAVNGSYGPPLNNILKWTNPSIVAFTYLLNHGANPNKRDKRGLTALHELVSNKYLYYDEFTKFVNALFERSQKPININAKSSTGNTVLHLMIEKNSSPSNVKFILDKKPDISIKNREGLTAMELATRLRNQPIIQMLKEYQK